MRVDGGKRFRRTNRKKEGTHMTAIIVAGILAVTAVTVTLIATCR